MRKIVIVMMMILVLTACGKPAETVPAVDSRQTMMNDIQVYLTSAKTGKTAAADAGKLIRATLPNYKGNDAEKFKEIADKMDQNKVDEVSKLYQELGGK
ncbi:hypothetical protein SAMN02799630_02822 [Paenibacillus sp. UNCCL117]|uniref:hypothetical protein n=1 Tax=unclassified Paenibacillus TaxID=185978 RepID=UPI000880AB76|nr:MULTISPECIES: hypothetical protein [unclassified Paenibacillus]SDD29085.1 hypothetical protein SAMN04488602_107169 [Paenibacillus sp. cl123]SFW40802.1 hypothetical protein SAMN02799630_02822 [Paenibacillus sp. UNCCL117]